MTDNQEGKKSKILQSISKIISGFLIGLGFSIALLIVFASAEYIWDFDEKEIETQKEDIELPSIQKYMPSFIEFDDRSGLIIENHEPRKYDTKLIIIGQIKNTGQKNWERIHIEVELFDSNKNFVDQCSGLIWGTVKANQTRNFKVTCGECGNEPLVEFSTYEIKILDASHKKMN
jgi:hypothetical protein